MCVLVLEQHQCGNAIDDATLIKFQGHACRPQPIGDCVLVGSAICFYHLTTTTTMGIPTNNTKR